MRNFCFKILKKAKNFLKQRKILLLKDEQEIKMKKNIILVCNAHLDPVWQWTAEEGIGAAISTFSAAADLCEEKETLVFNHNEAVLYQYIEEVAPDLFERIRKLVKMGRWKIVGGWYLQPDCNMPSGESILRQIEAGRKYFSEKFGVCPDIAVNYDSFGHSRGLVQILQKSDYRGYICCRPLDETLQDRDIVWKGYDGSEVLLYRATSGYSTLMGQAAKYIEKEIKKYDSMPHLLVLWGVGNHGGGPSRKDLADIDALQAKYPDLEIKHGTLDEYFDEMEARRKELAVCEEGLNYVMQGCYTSQIRIKQKHQELENALCVTEKMLIQAEMTDERSMQSVSRASEDLMFGEFHDILPGTSIRRAEQDALRMYDHGLEELSKLRLKAFMKLSGSESRAAEGEFPIFVYNPNPWDGEYDIECELSLADQNWSETQSYIPRILQGDQEIPCQLEKEDSNIPLDWRKKIVFRAKLKACSMNRFSCYMELKDNAVKDGSQQSLRVSFEGGYAEIDGKTGGLARYVRNGKEWIGSEGTGVEVIQSCCDPWGFRCNDYRTKIGEFFLMTPERAAKFAGVTSKELAPIRLIEDGPIRSVVEALLEYGDSRLVCRYRIGKQTGEIDVRLTLFQMEKDVVVKYRIPTAYGIEQYVGKTCFGVEELKRNGDEMVAQDWVLASDKTQAMQLIHFGNYGSSCDGKNVRLTLIRSSAYTAHPIYERTIMHDDRFDDRIDQGERDLRFVLEFGETSVLRDRAERSSREYHQAPIALNYFPTHTGKRFQNLLKIDDSGIVVTAIRSIPEKNGILIRFFNPLERKTTCRILESRYALPKEVTCNSMQFRTFISGADGWKETDALGNEKE